MKKIYYAIISLIALSFAQLAHSATGMFDRFQYGIFADYIFIRQDATFQDMPNVFSCSPGFTTGEGYGMSGGLLAEYPFGKYGLIGLRGAYSFLHTQTSAYESFPYQFGNSILTGLIKHHSEINMHNITTDAYLGLRLFGNVILSGGVQALYSFRPTFSQYEQLEKPSDFGAFTDGRRIRNEYYDYKLENVAKPVLFAKAGISCEILLNNTGTVRLVPEFAYIHPLNSLITPLDWNLTGVSGGLALKFSRKPKNPIYIDITSTNAVVSSINTSCHTTSHEVNLDNVTITSSIFAPAGVKYWELNLIRNNEVIKTKSDSNKVPETFTFPTYELYSQDNRYPIEYKLLVIDNDGQKLEKYGTIPLIIKDRQFISNLITYGLDENGNKIDLSELKVEIRIFKESHPLLNYIFFEDKSDELPERYSQLQESKTNSFEVNNIKEKNVITIYREVLNIIGQRMRNAPESEITLKGFVSAGSKEYANLDLANRRAKQVKDYLVRVWKIDSNRINIETNSSGNGLPPKPSIVGEEQNYKQTNEENQRVEIYTKPEHSFLLDPVTTSEEYNQTNPVRFVVKPNIENSGQKYTWNLEVAVNGKAIEKYNGLNQNTDSILIDLSDRKSEIVKNAGSFDYYFFAKDDKDLQCYKEGKVQVKLRDADSSVSKYSLILFDFRSSSLGDRNNQIVNQIRNSITSNSTIRVTGFTDILGDFGSNIVLSKNRAINAAKSIIGDQSLGSDAIKNINNTSNNTVISDKLYNALPFDKNITNVKLSVMGMGETEPLLYDNSTPEGRFYSRTVTISIIKKNK